ncbi:hypothetical protein ACIBBD_12255 [Streptomyces sp. NPDC051315]
MKEGRLPPHRLIGTYAFGDIDRAARDITGGRTIKPALPFRG